MMERETILHPACLKDYLADHKDKFYSLRQKALQQYHGLPSRQDENWKYLRFQSLEKMALHLPDKKSVLQAPVPFGIDHYEIVVTPFAIQSSNLPADLNIRPITDSEPEDHVRFEAATQSAFLHLNTALFHAGFVLDIPADYVVDKPIVIHYLLPHAAFATLVSNRVHLNLAHHSQATIIENYATVDGLQSLVENTVFAVKLAAHAKLNLFKLQVRSQSVMHIANLWVEQSRDSQFVHHHMALGAKLARDDIRCELIQTGAVTSLNGVYLLNQAQVIDNHLSIQHRVDHCQSQQNYKGIVGDQSQAVFNGKTVVHANTKQNKAVQNNANLLLSDNAEVDAKPELEIYADEVSCSHGCTVGGLDETALFYLQSRGIPLSQAKQLLMRGFVAEITETIEREDIADIFNTFLFDKLANLLEFA